MSTSPQFFDVHAYAHFAAFKDDSDAVIRHALESGALSGAWADFCWFDSMLSNE